MLLRWDCHERHRQPAFCGPAQWSQSQTGLGDPGTRAPERGHGLPDTLQGRGLRPCIRSTAAVMRILKFSPRWFLPRCPVHPGEESRALTTSWPRMWWSSPTCTRHQGPWSYCLNAVSAGTQVTADGCRLAGCRLPGHPGRIPPKRPPDLWGFLNPKHQICVGIEHMGSRWFLQWLGSRWKLQQGRRWQPRAQNMELFWEEDPDTSRR